MKLEGLRELEDKLRALGAKDGSRAIRTALLAAGRVVATRARQNAEAIRNGSGALALSISVRFVRGGSEDVPVGRRFVAQIGPRAKNAKALALYNLAYGRHARGIFYGHLIERGFKHRSGKRVSGQRILTNALQQTRAQAIAVFSTKLGAAIDRLVRKKAARSG